MGLIWCPAIDGLVDNGDNIVLRDVCDRPRGPSIDKLAAQLPLNNCGLSGFGNMPTKATLIYRRTGNLRAVQLLLGHRKIQSTVRYLGIDVG